MDVVILLMIFMVENVLVIQNKREDVNTNVFNIITGINKSKTLTKHILFEYKCRFDVRKCNSNQKWNIDKCWCECKNPAKHPACKKDYAWVPSTCSCKIDKYLKSVIGDLVVTCDKIIDMVAK